jgi:lysophospholipase L1-like esterase
MSANQNSRRNFLKKAALSTLSALIMPDLLAAPEDELNNKVPKDDKGLVFLFQGDSITDGNRGRNYKDLNHILGHGYPFSIASRIGYDFPGRNLTFVNRGISGNRVTSLADRWKVDCLDLNPDVLSILVGINDTSSNIGNNPMMQVTLQKYDEVYRSLLNQVVKQNPDILFVLNQPFVFRHPSTEKNWEERYKDVIERQKIVEEISFDYKAVFVRLQDVFNEACKRAPAEYWIWDGIHPTVCGHELITREWIRLVRKRLRFIKSA